MFFTKSSLVLSFHRKSKLEKRPQKATGYVHGGEMSKSVAMLIPFLGAAAVQAFAADNEFCRAPLITAATQSFMQLSQTERESFYYNHTCDGRQSDGSNGFDAFIDSVLENAPLKIDAGAQRNSPDAKQWCEENKEYARDKNFSSRIYKTVFAPSVASFNSCVAANNANLSVSVKPSNAYHLIVAMKNNNHKSMFQGVKINPETAGTCDMKYKNKTHRSVAEKLNFPFDTGETITFDCIRQSQDGRFYPAVSFDFRNDIQNFTYVMARYDQSLTDKKFIEPDKHITPLDGVIVSAAAYWAGGHKSYTKKCVSDPDYMTFVGTLSTSIDADGTVPECLSRDDLQGNEPCTGGDEYCTVTTAKGCYVSTDWLNWYKDYATSKSLKISNDQICASKDRG